MNELGDYGNYGGNYQPVKSTDQDFMQWLFNFSEEVVKPQEMLWRGHQLDEHGRWVKPITSYPVMNDLGISWCISYMNSYINPAFVVSNFDEQQFNFTMREAIKPLYTTLKFRYKEFGMKKTDILRVAAEIESKIRSIVLGARDNGFRNLFSTTRQYQEVQHKNINQNDGGIISGVKGLFKKPQETHY